MLLTTTVVIVLAGTPFAVYEVVNYRRTSMSSLSGLGDIVASNSTAALAFSNPVDANEVLSALRARPHVVAAALYNDRGQLFASYPEVLPADSFPDAPGEIGVVANGPFIVAHRPVLQSNGRRLGTLLIKADTEQIAERMRLYGYMAAGMLALSLLAGYVVAGRLQGRISAPILDLANTARAIAERNDYSVRAKKLAHAEIGLLTDAFNQMLDQIERQARQVRETSEQLDVALRHDNAMLERRVNERTIALEAANEELRAFSYSVAHDLRAPLRAMHGFSQALLEDCKDSVDEMAQEYARRIAAAAQRMDELTRDLLAYSQVGRSELVLTSVDLGSVVNEATRQLEADITSRNARVTVHEPLPRAIAHPPALVQSIANLISNGLKFVDEGKTPAIDIRAETLNGVARLWVEDNGIGIAPAYHQRVFTVFERLHTGSRYAGTGIGLAIVRKAIERMGGSVGVESDAGAGSRFWIELKLAEA
jgi:signal transduction histidine kinase